MYFAEDNLPSIHNEDILIIVTTKELVIQLCLTLWDPIDCSLPGSSVHGILQVRILD